ncbi:serine/arginine repetitive matrix protein 1-like [Triticum urartu]|uniref:serine/arginine repetitive matrix protein 1-like n=1 Tax=Triticum urartu TaxID=4572 RepID=UPI002043E55A|nr:serine/arginine repetitive matrix protein 1-like [Triticum urartu]
MASEARSSPRPVASPRHTSTRGTSSPCSTPNHRATAPAPQSRRLSLNRTPPPATSTPRRTPWNCRSSSLSLSARDPRLPSDSTVPTSSSRSPAPLHLVSNSSHGLAPLAASPSRLLPLHQASASTRTPPLPRLGRWIRTPKTVPPRISSVLTHPVLSSPSASSKTKSLTPRVRSPAAPRLDQPRQEPFTRCLAARVDPSPASVVRAHEDEANAKSRSFPCLARSPRTRRRTPRCALTSPARPSSVLRPLGWPFYSLSTALGQSPWVRSSQRLLFFSFPCCRASRFGHVSFFASAIFAKFSRDSGFTEKPLVFMHIITYE